MHNVQTVQYSAIIATTLFLCHWHAYHHALLSGQEETANIGFLLKQCNRNYPHTIVDK